MSRPLSTTQREVIRLLHDNPSGMVAADARTIRSLRKRGLVSEDSFSLTGTGQMAYDRIMASGDGPEALKGMLRLG